ncbi:MAG: ketopantoate reductase family protein, partial [Myxococcales bacterium]
MKFAMFGAGGVGGYYGARLSQAGHEVVFIARGAHASAMRDKGLTIKSELGDANVRAPVFEDPAQAGVADVIVVAVKLWDSESAAQAVRPMVGL